MGAIKMNIEEIKVRLSNLDEGKIVKFDYAINLATQALWDYKHDITYLLSIIEQAEKDNDKLKKLLLKSSDGFRTIPYSKEEIEFIAKLRTEQALKAIREG